LLLLQPLLDIVIYAMKLTGAIGAQVCFQLFCTFLARLSGKVTSMLHVLLTSDVMHL